MRQAFRCKINQCTRLSFFVYHHILTYDDENSSSVDKGRSVSLSHDFQEHEGITHMKDNAHDTGIPTNINILLHTREPDRLHHLRLLTYHVLI